MSVLYAISYMHLFFKSLSYVCSEFLVAVFVCACFLFYFLAIFFWGVSTTFLGISSQFSGLPISVLFHQTLHPTFACVVHFFVASLCSKAISSDKPSVIILSKIAASSYPISVSTSLSYCIFLYSVNLCITLLHIYFWICFLIDVFPYFQCLECNRPSPNICWLLNKWTILLILFS